MAYPTINIWFASEAPRALIICKFPKDLYEMVMWDLETDTFKRGQWLTKKSIRMDRCGLSPNGKYFGYFILDGRNMCATYTVISKPPYFTGLYCQAEEGTWTGGAYFEDDETIIMKPYILKFNNLPDTFTIVDPSTHPRAHRGGREERMISFHETETVDGVGRTITTDKGIIYIDGMEAINFNNDKFVNVKAPY